MSTQSDQDPIQAESLRSQRLVDEAASMLYDEMRSLARDHLSKALCASLSPTDLVHECFVRLARHESFRFLGRPQFLALVSRVLRQVLLDHARSQQRRKHGDNWKQVTLCGTLLDERPQEVDLLELHEALQRLAGLDPGLARLVELRFIGGLTMKEIADVLGVTTRIVGRDWELARAWLRREMTR